MSRHVPVFQILWESDPVVKLTLLLLMGLSVACWAIIFFKHREIKNYRLAGARYFDAFSRAQNLEDFFTKFSGRENRFSNISRAAVELLKRKKSATPDGIRKRIDQAIDHEMERVELYIPFLATTGSSAPFIGLFGTVWGILAAFWQIGKAGSSSLAVVGPFIAEALIATAFGLAAAIPAVIFYNFFIARIRTLSREMQSFGEELALRIEREIS